MEKKNKYLVSTWRWKFRYFRPRRKKREKFNIVKFLRKKRIERKLIRQKVVYSSLKKRWFEKSLLKKKLENEPFSFYQGLVPLTFINRYRYFLESLNKKVEIEVIFQNYFLKDYLNKTCWSLLVTTNKFKSFFRPLMEQKVLSFFIRQIGLTLVRYRKNLSMKKKFRLLKSIRKKKGVLSRIRVRKITRALLGKKKKVKKRFLPRVIDKSFGLVNHWITFKVTQNNSFMTVINKEGEVLLWHSAGQSGFKGPRRSTPYASRMTGIAFFKKLIQSLRRELGGSLKTRRGKKKYPPVVFGFLMKSGRKRKVKMLLKGFLEMMKRTRRNRRTGRIPNIKLKCIIRKQRFSHNGLRKKKKRRL